MDEAVQHLEETINNMGKKIDTLIWKIKKFERIIILETKTPYSCKIMTMMTNFNEICRKYDEILLLITENINERIAFSDTLQLHINLVRSKIETLQALITKGRTIEF